MVQPQFPHFKKLSIDDAEIIKSFTEQYSNYSDFNFVSLFSWDVHEKAEFSFLNGNLVLKMTDYITDEHFYTFLGNNKIDDTVHKLTEHSELEGRAPELLLIPHDVAQQFTSHSTHIVEEDHDNHDYILSVPMLQELKASQFRGKRNLLNRFHRLYGDIAKTCEIDLTDLEIKKQVNKVIIDWAVSQNRTLQDIENEVKAIKRNLEHVDRLHSRGFGVYVGDELVAFTIYELLPGNMTTIHFSKANVNYIGIFEHMNHKFAHHVADMGIHLINYEQDLGIEGLRRAKMSHHPVDFLKKYVIKKRS